MMRMRLIMWLMCNLLLACTSGEHQQQAETAKATPPNELSQSVSTRNDSGNAVGSSQKVDLSADSLQIVGTENQYDIILPTDVLFDFDKWNLRPDGIRLLEKVKQHVAQHGADQLHVWGHTDSKGSDQYNAVLSQKRAVAVANWLKKQIKVKGLIMAIGRGEKEPLVSNTNADGSDNPGNRQKNRRVMLSVVSYPDTQKMLKQAREHASKSL